MGPDRGNMGGVPKLQCSFLQETDKYSGLCEQEHYCDRRRRISLQTVWFTV